MPLSSAERQKRYRQRMESEGKKRYQVLIPNTVADQAQELCKLLNCTKGELITRLLEEEYKRLIGNNK